MSLRVRAFSLSVASTVLAIPVAVSCSSPVEETGDLGESGAGMANGGASGTQNGGAPMGGASGTSVGGAGGTGTGGTSAGGTSAGGTGASGAGTGGVGGTGTSGAGTGGASVGGATAGGASGAAPGGAAGGVVAGAGGAATTGGSAGMGMGGAPGGMGGMGVAGSFVAGGMGGAPVPPALDCGGKGQVIENNGPPANRVNYAILGDGYTAAELDTTYIQHIQTYMTKRFSDPIGQPYLRYRKFVNICAVKVPSTPICGSSAFGCCGNDSSRLATCNQTAANNAFSQNLPASFEIDWRALVLNGSSWWNTGQALMLWSGGNRDAAGAALHEGGHGHHQLADEYANCGSSWVNNTNNNQTSGGKWDAWIGTTQTPTATGMQGFFACTGGSAWRPTDNSMMNSLFGNNVNTSFNSVSREKMIMDIWRIISNPWDSVVPPAGPVTNPTTLTVNVIDPAVISVDWSVDGNLVAMNGGTTYNIGAANLAAGTHMVVARAYDNASMDLVRQKTGTQYNRQYWATNAIKSVTWTVTKQ